MIGTAKAQRAQRVTVEQPGGVCSWHGSRCGRPGEGGLVGAFRVAEEDAVEDEEQETKAGDKRTHTEECLHQADKEAGDSQDEALR